jgi:hypothetical protein
MSKPLRGAYISCLLLAALPPLGGCGDGNGGDPSVGPQGDPPGASMPPGSGTGPGASVPGIKQIMGTLARGPKSLTQVLGKELKESPPPWETVQAQAKEYARLAGDMGKYDPPKGSKESWSELTADFAALAADMGKAAQARDSSAALAAHTRLTESCNACHKEHRRMGRGMGGPPGGFPGGPPPGGPPR